MFDIWYNTVCHLLLKLFTVKISQIFGSPCIYIWTKLKAVISAIQTDAMY